MGVMRQQIARFENMSNSPTIFFLVKYANALDTEVDVILNGVELGQKNTRHLNDGRLFQIDVYNLDVIIAVGYRVNLKRGTIFRQ